MSFGSKENVSDAFIYELSDVLGKTTSVLPCLGHNECQF